MRRSASHRQMVMKLSLFVVGIAAIVIGSRLLINYGSELALLLGVTPWTGHSFPWLLCVPALLCAAAAAIFTWRMRLPRVILWLIGVSCLAFLDASLVRG